MRNIRYIKIDFLSYITAIAYVTITYRIVKFFIWEFLINIKLAIHHHRILQCTFAVGQNKSLVGKSIRCYDFERLPSLGTPSWKSFRIVPTCGFFRQNLNSVFSSAGEKSDSSGSSGSESPNRSQNNSENGPQTWLGTLNGFDSENGRCPESSFHNPGAQLYTGAPGHTNFHEIEQETQYYYRTGSIIPPIIPTGKYFPFENSFFNQ